jgi:HAD superfamily hydrolase (TIGR01549 family)
MKKINFKCILLDFDGVILDSTRLKEHTFKRIFNDYDTTGIEININKGGKNRKDKIYYYLEKIGEKNIKTKQKVLVNNFSKLIMSDIDSCKFIPGVLNFLVSLHHVIPLFIVSGTPQEELEEIIQKRGITHFFKEVHGSYDKKENIINHISKKYNTHNMLFIGDNISDYKAALRNNIQFIGRGKKKKFPKHIPVIKDFLNMEMIK